jgi:L-ascorbate metabolism protein UlaG (beta-lactamase superfamily)
MRVTWYGHSAFRLDFAGKAVLIDPFFTGQSRGRRRHRGRAEGRVAHPAHHGHSDHVGDAIAISQKTGAKVVANYDLCMWLAGKGLEKFDPMNTGGTTDQGGFTVTLVRADHSSAVFENGVSSSLGNPHGQGRADRLSHGRHRHLLRHGADRRALSARRGHGADSATASP